MPDVDIGVDPGNAEMSPPGEGASAQAARAAAARAQQAKTDVEGLAETVSGDAQAVETARGQVEADAAQVAEDLVEVEAKRSEVEINAAQVSADADAVAISRTVTEQAATEAAASAASASLSAAQANVAADLYPNAAAGLADTTSGEYFSVLGTGDTFAILYENVAGSAVERSRFPSKAAVDYVSAAVPRAEALDRYGRPDLQRLLSVGTGSNRYRAMYRILTGADAGRVGLPLDSATVNYVNAGPLAALIPVQARTDQFLAASRYGANYAYATRVRYGAGSPWFSNFQFPAGGVDAGKWWFALSNPMRIDIATVGIGDSAAAALFTASEKPFPLRYRVSDDGGRWREYKYRDDLVTPAVAFPSDTQRLVVRPTTGQSLSIDAYAGSRVDTTNPYPHESLMLSQGLSQGGYISLLDYSGNTDFAVALPETDGKGTGVYSGLRWRAARSTADGRNRDVVCGVTYGISGQPIDALRRGTIIYQNGQSIWKQITKLARKYRIPRVDVPAVTIQQGENNRSIATPRGTYEASLHGLTLEHQEDIPAVTGQSGIPIALVQGQLSASAYETGIPAVAAGDIALAQMDAVWTGPRVLIAAPAYFLKNDTAGPTGLNYGHADGVHMLVRGYGLLGEYREDAALRWQWAVEDAIARGDDPFDLTHLDVNTCLRFDRANVSMAGTQMRIPLLLPNGYSSLTVDTTTLPAATNLGMTKVSGTAGAITSSSLTSVGGWAILVNFASGGTATVTIANAIDAAYANETDRSSAWSNIRTDDAHTPDSIAVPALKKHHWICTDEAVAA